MFRPLKFRTLDAFKWLNVAVEKKVGQLLLAVCALLELCLCDGCGFPEIAVSVEDFVHLVFNFCLQVKLFQQFGNRFLNFMGCGLTVSNDCLCVLPVWLYKLIFQRLLYLPEDVAVPHVLENKFALFGASEAHILF